MGGEHEIAETTQRGMIDRVETIITLIRLIVHGLSFEYCVRFIFKFHSKRISLDLPIDSLQQLVHFPKVSSYIFKGKEFNASIQGWAVMPGFNVIHDSKIYCIILNFYGC